MLTRPLKLLNWRRATFVLYLGVALALHAFAFSTPAALGAEMSRAAAEAVGVATDRLGRVTALSERWVAEGRAAGVVTAIARGGQLVHLEAVGARGTEDQQPMTTSDLFRIYSMTKPVTAVAAMQLYEQGLFQLDDPVSEFLPEFEELEVHTQEGPTKAQKQMTMHQLLTHTTGLSYGFYPDDPVDKAYIDADIWSAVDLDDFVSKIADLPLQFEPGERWHYSIASDILGAVIQRISGVPLNEYFEKEIFEPLGMVDTFFQVPGSKLRRLLPVHAINQETGVLETISPNDYAQGESECAALCDYENVTLYSGGAGLLSTANDYLRFALMLRNGGVLDGQRILGAKTIHYMMRDHLGDLANKAEGRGFGLGFGVVMDTARAGVLGSHGEVHWSGSAGTTFWLDRVEDLIGIGLVQVVSPRPELRDDLRIATYQALTESHE